jgi:hypothetical protein
LSVASSGLPGDYNFDGTVDAADYVVLRKGAGVAPTPANYNLWRTNFGNTLSGSGSADERADNLAGIPEPATWGTLLIGIASIIVLRRYPFPRGRD